MLFHVNRPAGGDVGGKMVRCPPHRFCSKFWKIFTSLASSFLSFHLVKLWVKLMHSDFKFLRAEMLKTKQLSFRSACFVLPKRQVACSGRRRLVLGFYYDVLWIKASFDLTWNAQPNWVLQHVCRPHFRPLRMFKWSVKRHQESRFRFVWRHRL